MSKGPGYLLLAGGLGVHGKWRQHACIRGHLALVIQVYDDDPPTVQRERVWKNKARSVTKYILRVYQSGR